MYHPTPMRMRQPTLVASPATEHELVITRVFFAPVERVFSAWTDPAQMAAWWGPHEFSNPVCAVDARSGGTWRITMRSPEGVDFLLRGTFIEVVPNGLLVLTMAVEEQPSGCHSTIRTLNDGVSRETLVTITFSEDRGATTLVMRQRFASAAERAAQVDRGAFKGWGQSFDSLEELLLKQQDHQP